MFKSLILSQFSGHLLVLVIVCRLGLTDLCESRALHIFDGLQVSSQLVGRLWGDGLLLVLGQLLDGGRVVPQVNLSSN